LFPHRFVLYPFSPSFSCPSAFYSSGTALGYRPQTALINGWLPPASGINFSCTLTHRCRTDLNNAGWGELIQELIKMTTNVEPDGFFLRRSEERVRLLMAGFSGKEIEALYLVLNSFEIAGVNSQPAGV